MAVGRGRSSASATDAVARSTASTALTTAQTMARPPNTSVAPGEYTFTGGYIYSNETAAPLTMPATTDEPAMLAAGFTEMQMATVDEVVVSTTDLTGAAPAGAKEGINVTTGREFDVSGGFWTPRTAAGSVLQWTSALGTLDFNAAFPNGVDSIWWSSAITLANAPNSTTSSSSGIIYRTGTAANGFDELLLGNTNWVRSIVSSAFGAWSSNTPAATLHRERLAVATDGQTAFTLTNTPTQPASLSISVNGSTYELVTSVPAFTLSGTAVNWTGPFGLETTDEVVAAYL